MSGAEEQDQQIASKYRDTSGEDTRTLESPCKDCWIKFQFIDKESGKPVEGLPFTVEGPEEYKQDHKTGTRGSIELNAIPCGKYTLASPTTPGQDRDREAFVRTETRTAAALEPGEAQEGASNRQNARLIDTVLYKIEGKENNDTLTKLGEKYSVKPEEIADTNWKRGKNQQIYDVEITAPPDQIHIPQPPAARNYDTNKVHIATIEPVAKDGIIAKIMREAQVERKSSWGTRAPSYHDMQLDWGHDVIVIHHSGDEVGGAKGVLDIERLHFANSGGKWDGFDIGYHFLVDKQGKVHEARGLLFKGSHVSRQNTKKIGILVMGDYHKALWPDFYSADTLETVQLDGVKRIAKVLKDNLPTITDVKGHRDFVSTDCPGDILYENIVAVRQHVFG